MARHDEALFVEFVHVRSPALYRIACLLVGDPVLAEDLLQQALVQLYARWAGLREPASAESYVRTTLVRSAISWPRRQAWKSETLMAELPAASSAGGLAGIDERLVLLPLLRSLPARQRAVVVLRYYEDMSEEQIASVLGCSRGAVKSHASRAMGALRKALAATDLDRRPR